MANTKIPVELSSTPGIVDNSNATAITIDSSENVGIGTASPVSPLQVNVGTNLNLGVNEDSSTVRLSVYNDAASSSQPMTINSSSTRFDISGSERVRIDSSGNVGIGTTSPNHDLHIQSTDPAIILAQSGSINNSNSGRILFAESPSFTTTNAHFEIKYDGLENHLYFGSPIDGSTDLFVVGRDGNVGIGLTNPSDYYSTSLVVNANNDGITLVSPTNAGSYIMFADGTSSQEEKYRGYIEYAHSIDTLISRSAGAIQFLTGGSNERMRIGSDGNLLIGQTSNSITYGKLQVTGTGAEAGFGGIVRFNDPDGSVASSNVLLSLAFSGDNDATGGLLLEFRDSVHRLGSITAASGTTIAYNTSSDKRLKENIVDASSQLDVIKNIQVREFDWKTNGHHEVGMIAQELNDVIPNVVQEGGDDVTEQPWGVDYGKLTPYLVKAIQEQQTQIDALQSEINKLKGE